MADENGDLSDFDIHRIMEALQSRQSKTVASCVLSIKVLLTEIQQQLLNLMANEKEVDSVSEASHEANNLNSLMPDIQPITNKFESDQISDDRNTLQPNTIPGIKVSITGAVVKTPPTYPCSQCTTVCSTKKALSRHILTHVRNVPVDDASNSTSAPNDPSDTADNTESSNQDTKKRKAPPRKAKAAAAKLKAACELCGTLTLRQHMARHMLKHTGYKPFKCDVCGFQFSRKDKLKEHLRKHEEGKVFTPRAQVPPKELACKKCDYKTENKAEYRAHQKTHPNKMKYRCEECDKEFSCPSHLQQHNIKHRKDKPFMCEMCGVSFSREPNLARHIRSHVNPAPFHCKFCNKPYHRQNELVVHERKHTGEKPFICEICGNGYAATKYLKRHLFTHTGLKPYKCDVCERAFSRLENMRAHRKLHDKGADRMNASLLPADALSTAYQTAQDRDSNSAMALDHDSSNSQQHAAGNMSNNAPVFNYPSHSHKDTNMSTD